MARLLSAAASGLLFGYGLALSGMTNPDKVLDFLDVAGDWDPSLLFVLGGAVAVALLAFRFILRQPEPLFERRFALPTAKEIDGPLVVGAIVFGVGWGISGYCPGPAFASLASPNWETLVFLPAVFSRDVAAPAYNFLSGEYGAHTRFRNRILHLSLACSLVLQAFTQRSAAMVFAVQSSTLQLRERPGDVRRG
jgi:uncharacterized membrane protein YedE/YeeE